MNTVDLLRRVGRITDPLKLQETITIAEEYARRSIDRAERLQYTAVANSARERLHYLAYGNVGRPIQTDFEREYGLPHIIITPAATESVQVNHDIIDEFWEDDEVSKPYVSKPAPKPEKTKEPPTIRMIRFKSKDPLDRLVRFTKKKNG